MSDICNECEYYKYNSRQSADKITFENFCIYLGAKSAKKMQGTEGKEKVKTPKWCPK
jgi:hypothetical protein